MAKLLDIITDPDPKLRVPSRKLDPAEIAGLADLIADMKLTMKEQDGVGLAAPQIGQNLRIIVIAQRSGILTMIDPVLKKLSFFKEWGEEGCLSVPNTFGQVRRHRSLTCDYLDESGQPQTLKAIGLMARILQHEVDHLDGILFIDKAKNIQKPQLRG